MKACSSPIFVLDVRLDPDEFVLRPLDRTPQPFQLIVHLAGRRWPPAAT